ncbi:MAG: DegV family protein [Acholeplasmataceae bacterium]|nr:DegV family protein [Acholeplasmataceae bacterium]
MKEKIAILTDSGSDVLKEGHENLFVLPLLIHIDETTYTDGLNITVDEVLNLIDDHKIKTSLPSPDVIMSTLNTIKDLGYTHVIANTISSGLSGTYNIIRVIAEEYEGLEIALIDTKNISKGSGYTTVTCLELIEQGKSYKEIIKELEARIYNNKVFFTVKTVEYLRKGGRIGLVASAIASVLDIKPIISCNEDGVYHSIKNIRGYQKAINRIFELAKSFVEDAKAYDITLLVTKIDQKVNEISERVKNMFDKLAKFEIKKITPALAIHTGPEAFGIALRKIN